MPETKRIDLRGMPMDPRHALLFSTLFALRPGESMEVTNDHDPSGLVASAGGGACRPGSPGRGWSRVPWTGGSASTASGKPHRPSGPADRRWASAAPVRRAEVARWASAAPSAAEVARWASAAPSAAEVARWASAAPPAPAPLDGPGVAVVQVVAQRARHVPGSSGDVRAAVDNGDRDLAAVRRVAERHERATGEAPVGDAHDRLRVRWPQAVPLRRSAGRTS